jgi:hypothetical protein
VKELDRQVLGIVAAQAPLSESAIGMQMPGVHNEIIAGCLRRLREKHLERSEAGLWSIKDAPPAPPPQQEIAVSEDKKAATKCPKCGWSDFTAGGKCRPCKKVRNDAYRAKQNGKALPPPTTVTGKKKGKRVAGVPILMNGDRMVIMQFAIRVEDSSGVVHDLFLTGDVVKRLAIELQEYA